MSDQLTPRLGLPLLQAAQAQKHVTVNEALIRLDGVASMVLESRSLTVPPEPVPSEGCYALPEAPSGGWAGHGGEIALAVNGGWDFIAPFEGMQAYLRDEGTGLIYLGGGWRRAALSRAGNGSGLEAGVAEGEVVLGAGGEVVSDVLIPGAAMVIGATARVVSAITGTATSWSLGTAGALDRFGSGLGLGAGSWARGMLSQPMTYWSPEPLILTPEAGEFSGGTVRLAVHWLALGLPD